MNSQATQTIEDLPQENELNDLDKDEDKKICE